MQFFNIALRVALVVLILSFVLVVGAQVMHWADGMGQGRPGQPT